MLNKLRQLTNDEAGFTLIELLVVILIIGILAAIAIPVFLNQQKAAVISSVQADVRNTVSNVNLYIAENPNATTEFNVRSDDNVDTRFKLVVSDKETTIAARGTADAYFVLGRNTKISTWPTVGTEGVGKYKFNSGGFGVLYSSGSGKTVTQNS